MLRPGQVLYTYLHLAPDPEQTAALVEVGRDLRRLRDHHRRQRRPAAAGADERGGGAHVDPGRRAHLEKSKGGMGVLLGGVPGVAPGHVVILGGGVVGTHALQMRRRHGRRRHGARRSDVDGLRQLDLQFGDRSRRGSRRARRSSDSVLARPTWSSAAC